jgi:hypothetical protein|tara:strand:- start:948 stop:1205 length:258 start_codon:yes stop_codon:yes gene_type:complete
MTTHRVTALPVEALRVGDEVLRRATRPSTGRMTVDTVTRVRPAPPSAQNEDGTKVQLTWGDDPLNLSFHYPTDEVLVVRRSRWGR